MSGRIGTRRASVVYKIPRSTLRNKVYKLEAQMETAEGSNGVHSSNRRKRHHHDGYNKIMSFLIFIRQ